MDFPATKPCSKCKVEIPLEEYGPAKNGKYGRRSTCSPCRKSWEYPKRYGVTREQYLKNMASSDCCELCGTKQTLCYDHDHATMEFRGILCRMCNSSLGHFGDNEDGLRKVIKYLNRRNINE